MIQKIVKTLTNSALLVLLLGMLIFPITSMGIIKYQEKSTVLSAQDDRTYTNPDITNVPDEVEEMIMKLEREYYQSTESVSTENN
jgi:hypothetical protein